MEAFNKLGSGWKRMKKKNKMGQKRVAHFKIFTISGITVNENKRSLHIIEKDEGVFR